MAKEIPRQRVLEMLHGRGDHDDADRADLELPDPVDPDRDAGLLTKFGVHPPELMAACGKEPAVLEDTPNFRMGTLQQDVASAALSGIPGKEIDRLVIDPSPITDAEKDALRIYCWSFLPRSELRRMALERLRDLNLPDDSIARRRTSGWLDVLMRIVRETARTIRRDRRIRRAKLPWHELEAEAARQGCSPADIFLDRARHTVGLPSSGDPEGDRSGRIGGPLTSTRGGVEQSRNRA